jgi:molybdenum cofactor cytidylyltransferase
MIAGLILAAGESRRMGRDKALLNYRGRSFLSAIIATLQAAGAEKIAVVLGHHAAEIQRSIASLDTLIAYNPNYRAGQTSSLQAGLAALTEFAPEAVVLCLVDHPAVTPGVIQQLVERYRLSKAPVVIPTYHGERGHPVLLGNALIPELMHLDPGTGANSVIHKYGETTELVEVDDAGVVLDIDDPESYEKLDRRGQP